MSSPLAASSPNSSLSEPTLVPSQLLDTERLMQIASARSAEYRGAAPFPHIMLDG